MYKSLGGGREERGGAGTHTRHHTIGNLQTEHETLHKKPF